MTPKQNQLYQWLLARLDDPIGPSTEEMRHAMGLVSKAGVSRLINALLERGMVTRLVDEGGVPRPRSVRAVRRGAKVFDGVPTSLLIEELKRRGESNHG
jgi:SOS-response transcriptional repressor LexA